MKTDDKEAPVVTLKTIKKKIEEFLGE